MADQFDMKLYPMAMIQFGPSVVIRHQWISLSAIERIVHCDGECLVLVFKSGSELELDFEESKQFHEAMIAGAKQIQGQIQTQQAREAGIIARNMGIVGGN